MSELRQNFDDLNQLFGEMLNRGGDPRPMREIGVLLGNSIMKTFEVGGRPTAWLPSQRAQRQGGQTLLDTGRLMKSAAMPEVSGNTITLGSNLPYAAVHQYGFEGDVTVKSFTRKVRSRSVYGKAEKVNKKTGEIYIGREMKAQGIAVVRSFVRHMKIVARPFLGIQDEDVDSAGRIMSDYLTGT